MKRVELLGAISSDGGAKNVLQGMKLKSEDTAEVMKKKGEKTE